MGHRIQMVVVFLPPWYNPESLRYKRKHIFSHWTEQNFAGLCVCMCTVQGQWRLQTHEATTDCIWIHQNISGVGMSAWLFLLYHTWMEMAKPAASRSVTTAVKWLLYQAALGSRGQKNVYFPLLNLRIFAVSSPNSYYSSLHGCEIIKVSSSSSISKFSQIIYYWHLDSSSGGGSGSRIKAQRAFLSNLQRLIT